VFCQSCIESFVAEESATKNSGCRKCNKLLSNIRKSFPSPPAAEPERFGLWTGPSAMKPRRRGDDVNGVQPTTRNKSTFLADSDRELPNTLLPSAKTAILKSMLLDWCRLYPEDKIIGKSDLMCQLHRKTSVHPYLAFDLILTCYEVFTLFVDGGRIIGRMLQDANLDFLYYFGSMSHEEKYKAVKDFTEKKEIRVLVST
jgi:hypothetical protein